jgi:diketogulonate reductase-like aldo/keto reductase
MSNVHQQPLFFDLPDGNRIPSIGLGTWKADPGQISAVVEHAIEIGYRHVDCAAVYFNEKEIGTAFARVLSKGLVKREDLFVTSKLWNTCHRPEHVAAACKQTLADLQLDYLDLYLIHWPFAWEFCGLPLNENSWKGVDRAGDIRFDHGVTLQETWAAMESLVEQGLVRSIGVSNYGLAELHDLLSYARLRPVVNQIETHPLNARTELLRESEKMGIRVEAYSPLGSGTVGVLRDETIQNLAKKYGATPAQICLAWNIQRGCIVLPKSVSLERLRENLEATRIRLDEADMERISHLDRALIAADMRNYWPYPIPEEVFRPERLQKA